jgi:hypothetical protein
MRYPSPLRPSNLVVLFASLSDAELAPYHLPVVNTAMSNQYYLDKLGYEMEEP